MAILSMSLADIRIDGGTQSRESLCESTVSDYSDAMVSGDQFPPIVVFCDGSDNWLADGFHRFHAARKAGLSELQADMRSGTREDALWHAIGANKANGQRPSRGDVRHAVLLALRTWPGKLQSEIAAQVGCAQQYVSRMKSEFTTSGELTPPEKVTGRDGKTYPTSKPRKPVVEVGVKEAEQAPVIVPSARASAETLALRESAFNAARSAITRLQEIAETNPFRADAIQDVENWINFNR